MSEERTITGQCMCGAVRFSAIAAKPSVVACHCDMCRRWSSGPFMAVNCRSVAFEGDDAIGRVRSSEWAERGFCKTCGSNLFYHIVGSDDHQMAAGLLDDQTTLRLSLQVFSDRRPDFYAFANDTRTMTGAEVAAIYAPPKA